MTDNEEYSWLTRLPKVELHVHLEGAIPHDALWELIQKYGGDPSCTNRESLGEKFKYRDFPHFIETWVWKNNFLREYEDFTFIAESVAREFARQNIRYAELFYSPGHFAPNGLTPQRITEAIRSGLDAHAGRVTVNLVPDLIRDFDHFIQLFRWKNGFLREYEDFTFIAEAVAGELAHQNVRYAEMFNSLGHFAPKGLTCPSSKLYPTPHTV